MTIAHVLPLLSLPEVAARLNVSEATVRRKIEAGDIPAVRLGTGPQAPVRVDPDELERWLFAPPPMAPANEAAPLGAEASPRGVEEA
jgi:excisionase family DNA binding protein